jgi:hypothetical protein
MKFTSVGLIIVSLILAACSGRVDSVGNPGMTTSQEDSGPPSVSAFDYRKFYYGTSGVCGGSSFYFKLLKAADMNLGQRDGHDILVESSILIFENKSFEVEYVEKYILDYTPSGYKYKYMKSRYVSGNWHQEGDRLILGDLMEISGKQDGTRTVASVIYKKDIITNGLKNKMAQGGMVWSSSAIKSERETCPTDQETLGNFDRFKARETRSEIHLKSLSSNDPLVLGNVVVKKLDLLIDTDGHYYLVALAALPNAAFDWSFIIDSGIWQRNGSSLKLYNGVVNMTYSGNQVDLTFTRNLTLFTAVSAFPLQVEGKTVRLSFGYSDLTTDDLSDTYR